MLILAMISGALVFFLGFCIGFAMATIGETP